MGKNIITMKRFAINYFNELMMDRSNALIPV